MTTSILRVLTRDYLRRVWPGIALGVTCLVLIPFGLVEFLRSRGTTLDREAFDPFVFHFSYVGIAYIFFAAAIANAHAGLRHRLYALPISSRAIAGWLMVSAALIVAIANVATNWCYSSLMSVHWPVLGPTLFMIAFTTVLQCASWSLLDLRSIRLAVWMAIIIGSFVWFGDRYQPNGWTSITVPWFRVTPLEWSCLSAAWLMASLYGVRCLSRHRRGQVAALPTLDDVSAGIEDRIRERACGKPVEAFVSPMAAFRWFEWRRTRTIALGCGCVVAPFLCLSVWFDNEPLGLHRFEGFAVLMTVLPALSGLVLGLTLMTNGHDTRNERMPTFVATQPLSDRQLACGLLQNAFRASVTVWTSIVALVAITLLARLMRDGFTFAAIDENGTRLAGLPHVVMIPVFFAISFLTHWTSVGLVASTLWTGRGIVISLLTTGLICLGIGTLFVVNFLVPEGSRETVQLAIFITLSVGVFSGTLFAFARAWRRALIGSRTVGLAAAFWIVLATGGWLVVRPEPLAGAIVCGLLALCILPLPAAPLALSWNRHR